ncbi:ABC transporter G family member 11 [Ceratocystis platani]|uniref:ABC transporter G family member 11 n=1 Tax=Ceratocystis fimbriata f. sp. platani TaxID=88771 RepID=A0A0F8B4K5_CERFI|nr:ABC transporter G family member 11 [Ceratocystis platani]
MADAEKSPPERPPSESESTVVREYLASEAPRNLGVSFVDLTVLGVAGGVQVSENVLSQFYPKRAPEPSGPGAKQKTILSHLTGCVKPGEMILVIGRPGAGCTTLLNLLANRRHGYSDIQGKVRFGNMDEKEAEKFRGEIVMNTEDELFFPSLSVAQTMDFAHRMKLPESSAEDRNIASRYLLRILDIEDTINTAVGNEYIRGVSGGQRKRVSVAEVLTTSASVYCWDNSTRGLDASSALALIKALRAMTDILGLTTIVTLYQASNGIFDLFDKTLVLEHGENIYYGPASDARAYMENLGFICAEGANIGDFLTGVSVPTERKVRKEAQATFPRTGAELAKIYAASDLKKRMDAEAHAFADSETARTDTAKFRENVVARKAKRGLPADSILTVSFQQQVAALVKRELQLIWGDKQSLIMKHGATLVQALVSGSVWYDAKADSSGLFIKGGVLFWSMLYHCLVAMGETLSTFSGRSILAKHKEFAMYHPAAFCIAQIVADIPVMAMQVTTFSIIVYFMAGLKDTAGAYFTHWALIYVTAFCMTAFFRLCGAAFPTFDAASKVSGFIISMVSTYAGFMIPKPDMHPWFVWMYWINPLSYSFEALLANEFHGDVIQCVGSNLVPSGPEYAGTNVGSCTGIRGAQAGSTTLTGDQYLAAMSYQHKNIWRNFGILWAWSALFVGMTIYCTMNWKSHISGGIHLIPREKIALNGPLSSPEANDDKESQRDHSQSETVVDGQISGDITDTDPDNLLRNTSVFTWKDLSYTVSTPDGPRKLLDKVSGWVEPGTLGALMGTSGAGKTTLMDVLAQRKTAGVITGSVLVDGRELPVSFQRSAGYCEQFDVHEPLTTVREALEFSALMRQNRNTPDHEKLAYVDTVLDLLELRELEHFLIGEPGAGLSIEQRKRVSIGVELVAKPSILIFLDEPTSGLDGQSAYNTLRFLRKLTAAGQAVLCTIHQPSAQLFAQFDTLLLLTRGGKTVYQGPIGPNGATMVEYFTRHGVDCPAGANPAEFMIDVVSGSMGHGQDWNQLWLDSPERVATMEKLDMLIETAAAKPPGTVDDGHEFAVSMSTQTRLVTQRMNTSLYRNTDYVMNKFMLHLMSGLFNGFTFWKIGDSTADLQNAIFAIFNFCFVAPGVIAQLQPLFIGRRDIFEVREKKAKIYHWAPFVTGLIVSELPYLVISGFLYFVAFYWTVGFPSAANRAGGTFVVMILYEFLYTGIGQFIAAYAPNTVFASLLNPVIISNMVYFCGVLVPYSSLQKFWRYWVYYLDPFNYVIGSMSVFALDGKVVNCKESELAIFNLPDSAASAGQTCAEFLQSYLQGPGSSANLLNPNATEACRVCQFRSGDQYLDTLNLKEFSYGWRDTGIVGLFVCSSYALVFGLMKLRTKATKKASES